MPALALDRDYAQVVTACHGDSAHHTVGFEDADTRGAGKAVAKAFLLSDDPDVGRRIVRADEQSPDQCQLVPSRGSDHGA